jgi:predicted DNA-binding protein
MPKQFSFTLPEHIKKELEKEASKSGNSVAQIIRTAIVQYLEK